MAAPAFSFEALRDELRSFAKAELRTEVRAVLSEVLEAQFGSSDSGLGRSADRIQLGSADPSLGRSADRNPVESLQPVPVSLNVQELSARLHRFHLEILRFKRGLTAASDASGSDNCDAVAFVDASASSKSKWMPRKSHVQPDTSKDHIRPITPALAGVRYNRRLSVTNAPAYRPATGNRLLEPPRQTSIPLFNADHGTDARRGTMRSGAAWQEPPPLLGPASPKGASRGDGDESEKAPGVAPHCVVHSSRPAASPHKDSLVVVDFDDGSGGEGVGSKASERKLPVGVSETSSKGAQVWILPVDAAEAAPPSTLATTPVGVYTSPDCQRIGKGLPAGRVVLNDKGIAAGRVVINEVPDLFSRFSGFRSSRLDSTASDPHIRRSMIKASVSTQKMVGLRSADLKHTRWGKSVFRETLAVHSIAHAAITRIVVSNTFDYMMCVVLVANAVIIGAQVEHAALNPTDDSPGVFRTCEQLFCVIFTLELSARVYVFRSKFLVTVDWSWNLFDSLAVALALFEEIVVVASGGNGATGEMSRNVKQVKMLRFLRLLRALRVLRIARFVQELSNIIYLIVGSLWSFIWTFVLLMLFTYISATFVTQVVADHVADEDSDADENAVMTAFWGSIGRSVLSLFQGITGGVDWKEISDPLHHVSPVMPWVFVFYIGFAALVMLNLVTGVFVESAQSLSHQDKKLELIRKLRMVLDIAGIREGGCITWPEFEEQLEHPELAAFFEAISIERSEAETVFQLLDTGGDGNITAEEFVLGGLRLSGPAKAIDLARTQLSVDLARDQMITLEKHILDLKDNVGLTEMDAGHQKRMRAYSIHPGHRTVGQYVSGEGDCHIPSFLVNAKTLKDLSMPDDMISPY